MSTHMHRVVADVDDKVADKVARRRRQRQVDEVFSLVFDTVKHAVASIGQREPSLIATPFRN